MWQASEWVYIYKNWPVLYIQHLTFVLYLIEYSFIPRIDLLQIFVWHIPWIPDINQIHIYLDQWCHDVMIRAGMQLVSLTPCRALSSLYCDATSLKRTPDFSFSMASMHFPCFSQRIWRTYKVRNENECPLIYRIAYFLLVYIYTKALNHPMYRNN